MNISNHENLSGKFPPSLSNDALEGPRRAHARSAGKVKVAPVTWNRLDEARQFVRLAIDLRRDGRSLTSGRYAKRALSLFARESRIDDYDAIVARLCLADSRVMRRDFIRAETDYQDALSSIGRLIAARRSFDVRNVRAHALRGLANVALAHGEPLEAERQLLQALDMVEQKPGSSHESDATLMDDLGTLYRQTGRYEDASLCSTWRSQLLRRRLVSNIRRRRASSNTSQCSSMLVGDSLSASDSRARRPQFKGESSVVIIPA